MPSGSLDALPSKRTARGAEPSVTSVVKAAVGGQVRSPGGLRWGCGFAAGGREEGEKDCYDG